MDVTDALTGEHGVLHLLVEQLDEALGRLGTLGEIRAGVEPLALSLLGHHRAEEETLLQPYERETGSLGPLRCLRHEHQMMEHGVRALFRIEDVEHLRTQVRGLLDMVRRHLAREEELLFAEARQNLSSGERTQQGAQWAQFRGVTLPK